MSRATSATAGRRYGLERVCRTWERSRSALYARRARFERPARGARPARRGPTPALSDAQLLAAIRTDLARSPFQGEGHRKVHARLRILDRIRVSRGESDVEGGGGHGWVEASAGSGVSADGGSPEGERSRRRRRGGWGGRLVARAAVER